MKIEYEVHILDINVKEIVSKLNKIGAKKIAERNQRRYVYDLGIDDDNGLGKWIRLRDNGEKITLAVKEISHKGIDGTKEHEVEVKDFEETNKLLNSIGFFARAYQENKRISYVFDGVEIEIDSWPKIPTFLEIEGKSEEDVKRVVELLGFKFDELVHYGVNDIYHHYGINIKDFKELKFD